MAAQLGAAALEFAHMHGEHADAVIVEAARDVDGRAAELGLACGACSWTATVHVAAGGAVTLAAGRPE